VSQWDGSPNVVASVNSLISACYVNYRLMAAYACRPLDPHLRPPGYDNSSTKHPIAFDACVRLRNASAKKKHDAF
jgi:hypothetical protein